MNQALAQQNRKLNNNSTTGEKNISMIGSSYRVDVAGTYCGVRESVEAAIELRDAERERLFNG